MQFGYKGYVVKGSFSMTKGRYTFAKDMVFIPLVRLAMVPEEILPYKDDIFNDALEWRSDSFREIECGAEEVYDFMMLKKERSRVLESTSNSLKNFFDSI